MIKYKMVGSVYSEIRGSVCSGLRGSVSSGQVGSICAEFPVYPNPANNILNVSTEVDGATISIYNIIGELIISEKLTSITIINIEKLNNGTYLYKITDSNKQTVKTDKLVISK